MVAFESALSATPRAYGTIRSNELSSMSWRTMVASANDGVMRMSVTSLGPHCRVPPPTITMRMGVLPARSRYVSLAVEPAEQNGDGTRVVAQLVARSREDPHLRRAMSVGDDARVEVGHQVVVRTVHDE